MNLRFLSDESDLRDLNLKLLTLAIDSENCDKAHPGYIKVIEQLSSRDAHFLRAFSRIAPLDGEVAVETKFPAAVVVQRSGNNFSSWTIAQIQSSLDLLRGLSVVHFEFGQVMSFDRDSYTAVEVQLTQFGDNFVTACLPTTVESD